MNQPVISVDTKKKELIGNYKNPGQEWNRKQEPIPVKVHDFPDPEQGKVIPYGVYDLTHNQGWVNVGISHDTAEASCRFYSSMVENDGDSTLSRSRRNTNNSRRWWQ